MNSVLRTCFLIFLLFAGIPANITGQSVLPLAVENATWIIYHYDEFWGLSSFHALKVQGDTLFDNQSYKQVYRFGLSHPTDGVYHQTTEPDLVAFMRDDTTTSKVYAVVVGSFAGIDSCTYPMTEVLLYDFAIEAGDTVVDCRAAGHEYQMVIDTIYDKILFDLERRVWGTGSYEVLIEGVGYSLGLFTEASGIFSDDYITTLVDYCIGTNFECGLYTSTLTQDKIHNATIYPNPVRDIIHIRSEDQFEYAQIFTVQGSLLDQQMLNDWQSVHVTDYPQGLYFLVLRNVTGESVTARFVKE